MVSKNIWHKDYLKKGYSGMSEYSITMFKVLSRKYGIEIHSFLESLKKSFQVTKTKEMLPIVDAGLAVSALLGNYYARLSGDREPPLTKKELQLLDSNLENMTVVLAQIKDAQDEDVYVSKRVESIEKKYGISVADLKKRHAVSMGITAKADADRNKSSWLSPAGEFLQKGDGLKTSLISAVAGPMTPFVEAALGGVGKLMSWTSKKRQEARMRKVASERKLALQDLGIIPESVSEGIEEFATGDKLKDIIEGKPSRGKSKSKSGKVIDKIYPFERSEMKAGIEINAKQIEMGMFGFFDNRAMKAHWTKRVLAALEKISGKPAYVSDDKSFTVLVGISKFLPLIVGSLGIISVAIMQIAAFLKVKDAAGETVALAMTAGPSVAASNVAAKTTGLIAKHGLREGLKRSEQWISRDISIAAKTALGIKNKSSGGILESNELGSISSSSSTDSVIEPGIVDTTSMKMLTLLSGQSGLVAGALNKIIVLLSQEKVKQSDSSVRVSGSSDHHSEDSVLEYLQSNSVGSKGGI